MVVWFFSNQRKAEIVKNWFCKQLTDDKTEPLYAFDCPPRKLDYPITVDEVASAASSLKNNKACGPDNVAPELI